MPEDMCYTPAIRTCWPFGLFGIEGTSLILNLAWFAITMIYGICTKTSRSLYNHMFKSLGRFMLTIGITLTMSSVGFFMAAKSARAIQDPWEPLATGVSMVVSIPGIYTTIPSKQTA